MFESAQDSRDQSYRCLPRNHRIAFNQIKCEVYIRIRDARQQGQFDAYFEPSTFLDDKIKSDSSWEGITRDLGMRWWWVIAAELKDKGYKVGWTLEPEQQWKRLEISW
jgi:hypothetical protein